MRVTVTFDPVGDADPEVKVLEAGDDLLLVWREWGDDLPSGSLTHVVASGQWENVQTRQVALAIEGLADL